jgi:hypothetical protein
MNDSSVAYFDSEAGYGKAIDAVINAAQRQICIFDSNLARVHLEQVQRVMALGRFLSSSRAARLRIVLHDTSLLENRLPRFLTLLGQYGHANEVRRASEDLRNLADCFLIADDGFAVVRFHAAHPRGKIIFGNASETADLRDRFEQLWGRSSQCSITSALGL